ncbi:zinc-dependent alcohol dehydrogenase family protein [Curtobacterium flaccumfaciens]|uniref:zinc-dependent alcohol dehydrogenase family protein n=1 Tax=Curtobacterium flaccumfaciens TaxID=2035 RepID=UPI001BDEFE8C|nr:NAD(P)-dependent alcohol dehydrogenase [Curtobacterium flaccumfaciens]MBT1631555.1 NAD(P)-dependent alcohol dehydrogenase [Curtobacterium flaccumfaciens pv. oortii]MCS5524738.1 NAD(P)-dependent alcohol dehydrogenase [Curtobacterium flaccumfaciens pv. oortii]MCX2846864.1 NAD(P)-dependent alcohol dehydrogenase [Curtobacterium flaccumfaciens pv. oortii]
MRAWTLNDFGFDNLTLRNLPAPEPREHELLIEVSAASLNYRDKALVDGIYAPEKMPKGLVPIADFAGVVARVGEGVTKYAIGDRVTSHFYSTWQDGPWLAEYADFQVGGPLGGGLAEFQTLHEDAVVPTPASLTDEQAATLPIAALTPWFAMREYGDIGTGDTVLVQGTGGVSIFAIQIASALGARVIATSSSDEKLARARKLGASDTINYRTTPDWAAEALRLTEGRGVDLVLDVVGGKGLAASIRATRGSGMVAVVGFLDDQRATLDLMDVIWHQTHIQGIAVGHRRSFSDLVAFLEEHRIEPVIDTVYAFEDAKAAYAKLAAGAFGKIVIAVGDAKRSK